LAARSPGNALVGLNPGSIPKGTHERCGRWCCGVRHGRLPRQCEACGYATFEAVKKDLAPAHRFGI
jgi:hypothetical protein